MTLEQALGGIVDENLPKGQFSDPINLEDDSLVNAMSNLLMILLRQRLSEPEIIEVEEKPKVKLEMVPSPS